MTTIAEEEVPLLSKKEQESCITPEIKDLLKERRSTKNDSVEYKNLDKVINQSAFARPKSIWIKNLIKPKHFIDLIRNKHIHVLKSGNVKNLQIHLGLLRTKMEQFCLKKTTLNVTG